MASNALHSALAPGARDVLSNALRISQNWGTILSVPMIQILVHFGTTTHEVSPKFLRATALGLSLEALQKPSSSSPKRKWKLLYNILGLYRDNRKCNEN